MGNRANLRSIEAIRDFRATLAEFRDEVVGALSAVGQDVHRTIEWLEHDQYHYWRRQIRERQEDVALAKSDLARRRLQGSPDNPVDTTEQKKALRLAKLRLERAEEKIEEVRRWILAVQKTALEYEGQARQLENYSEIDLEKALATLDRIVESIEAYARTEPVSMSDSGIGAESVTRSGVGGERESTSQGERAIEGPEPPGSDDDSIDDPQDAAT